ncbi:ACP S-malonyltransferase [Streptomyces anandii]|uniref:ACP S-malonyltransferase n=1 Tax=Streptomyces anandii TaxID=285454 RepID=UPI000AC5353E|nr:ACP S-malonyltransferase [Streptomyces anandii]GGY15666.1 malonyl CoA-acyl carrier protein transacylase [Streptomyces anandii JCM 4720]
MTTKTAIVFPGMGPSRFAEVGKFLLLDPYARARLAEADEALGTSVFDNFREQTDDYSEFSQVAFLVNSMAMADRAEQTLGIVPDICTGPSFGQKAAAAYTGSLPFADVVRLTAELARLEEDFFGKEYTDVVTHSFVRTPEERLAAILADFDERGEWYEFSGHLDDGFTMLSLRERELDGLKERISKAGGYSMYTMRPPVHAPAFSSLRRRAEEEVFPRYEFNDPKLPVVTDQDGTVVNSAGEMRTMMLDTFDRPVDWPAVVDTLKREDVSRVCVTGPDNLFHRLDRTKDNFEVVTVGLPKRSRPPRRSS